VSPDLADDGRFGENDGCPDVASGPALFVRLRPREQASGYLAVYRVRGGKRFMPDDTKTLMMIAAWLAAALDHRRTSDALEKLAVTDDLTQVYNYRFLKTALRREIKRAGRFAQELGLIMIDVDNLKSYNDKHGHLRGSFLLKEIARGLAEQVRSFDLVAKYGGDEFTIILPQTGREGAMIVAERIRATIAEHAFPLAPQGSMRSASALRCSRTTPRRHRPDPGGRPCAVPGQAART
jgi:diguanylate cyclase (GGDEF)-like protein